MSDIPIHFDDADAADLAHQLAMGAACDRALEEMLHNMSAPAKSIVQFEGLGALATKRSPGGSGVTSVGYSGRQHFGAPVRFAIAPGWRRLRAAGFLRLVDGRPAPRTAEQREARLHELVDERANQLPLPDGCLLIKANPRHPTPWVDPLTVLAVLTKCTDTVWLRGKEASLAAALERHEVSLLVPPAFAARLPEATSETVSRPKSTNGGRRVR